MNRAIYFSFITLFCIVLFCPLSYSAEVVKISRYSFKYSATTTASPKTLWGLWRDVENWKDFDERLSYSYLAEGHTFKKGAVGYLKGKNAPKTKFILTEVTPEVSFTEHLKIPLYQTIELQRYYKKNADGTITFTHQVNFKGLSLIHI